MSWILTLKEILEATQGKLLSCHETKFEGIGNDTRQNIKNKIFIALKGDLFDGHDFLNQAIQKSVNALIVHDEKKVLDLELQEKITIILVKDTLLALQQLANFWRKKNKFKVIAITGSNGKTTTKEFTAHILSSKYLLHYSPGSYNNHWGVPFTLLEAKPDHEIVIVEMGMNHKGELKKLMQIAVPDIVLCTNVQRAHLGFFASLDELAEAKEEIYLASHPECIKIFNLSNKYTFQMFLKTQKRIQDNNLQKEKIFTFTNSKEISLKEISLKEINSDKISSDKIKPNVYFKLLNMNLNEIEFEAYINDYFQQLKVSIFGKQNINNLMAASAIALCCGFNPEEICSLLVNCKTIWGRNQIYYNTEKKQTIVFDAYNANPDSMKALLENIDILNGYKNKIAILGEMLELEKKSESLHKELALLAASLSFTKFFFIGLSSEAVFYVLRSTKLKDNFYVFSNLDDFLKSSFLSLLLELPGESLICLKASRGMKFEKILQRLQNKNYENS